MFVFRDDTPNKLIGREGETATFLSRCLLNPMLRIAVSPHVNSVVMFLFGSLGELNSPCSAGVTGKSRRVTKKQPRLLPPVRETRAT